MIEYASAPVAKTHKPLINWSFLGKSVLALFVLLLMLGVYTQAKNTLIVHEMLGLEGAMVPALLDQKEACEQSLPRDMHCRLEVHAVVDDGTKPAMQQPYQYESSRANKPAQLIRTRKM